MTHEDNLHWLVGLIEGEGSFLKPPPSRPNEPRVEVEMNDKDVIDRLGALIGLKTQKRGGGRKSYRVRICGKRAVSLMRLLAPYMSARRKRQIDRAIKDYVARNEKIAGESNQPFVLRDVCAVPMCANKLTRGVRCSSHIRRRKKNVQSV